MCCCLCVLSEKYWFLICASTIWLFYKVFSWIFCIVFLFLICVSVCVCVFGKIESIFKENARIRLQCEQCKICIRYIDPDKQTKYRMNKIFYRKISRLLTFHLCYCSIKRIGSRFYSGTKEKEKWG